ncbi:MAG TPA: SdiA-regulated domain-containing protein [Longimicrobiales bacterium]|nr:SdiA-regulated domain-containing protein [Longimicrobiales bacterium]
MTPLGWFALSLALAFQGTAQRLVPGIGQRMDLERRVARFDLPGRLAEVSGLAFSPDGGLLAHGDERGVVYTVDPATGAADRGFRVGEPPVADDLEGMAAAGGRLFMVSSGGRLYEFRVVRQGQTSQVRVTGLGLEGGCEAEGLAYHAASDALFVACKTLRPAAAEVRIHRVPLSPGAGPLPPIRIPLAAFRSRGHTGDVSPSGLDVDPATGTLVVVAARQGLLFEADLEGHLLDLVRLPARRHPQPEGIAFGPDGRLYIADEAGGATARITVYGPSRGGPS